MLDRDSQRAWCIAYFCSPGRGDITDWPKEFAETQIVTNKQFDSVKQPDIEAIGNYRKDWTLRWQEIMPAPKRADRHNDARAATRTL